MIVFTDNGLKQDLEYSDINTLNLVVYDYDEHLDCEIETGIYLTKSDAIKIAKYFNLKDEDLAT